MTEQTTTTPEQPPAPVPCGKCGSTEHTTGNHNSGRPASATMGLAMTPDGNHNSGRPAQAAPSDDTTDGNHNSGKPPADEGPN
jgi:hypothetical protein